MVTAAEMGAQLIKPTVNKGCVCASVCVYVSLAWPGNCIPDDSSVSSLNPLWTKAQCDCFQRAKQLTYIHIVAIRV